MHASAAGAVDVSPLITLLCALLPNVAISVYISIGLFFLSVVLLSCNEARGSFFSCSILSTDPGEARAETRFRGCVNGDVKCYRCDTASRVFY
jgi:hypothetical protein